MSDDKPKITDAPGKTIAVTVQHADRCRTCRFWKSREDPHHPEWGKCRKNPPRSFDDGDDGWPCPTADDWCGAHELRLYSVAPDVIFTCPFTSEQSAAIKAELQRWYKTPCQIECLNGDELPRHVLVDALRWLVNVCCDVGKAGGKPEPGEHDAALQAGMNVLAAEDAKCHERRDGE